MHTHLADFHWSGGGVRRGWLFWNCYRNVQLPSISEIKQFLRFSCFYGQISRASSKRLRCPARFGKFKEDCMHFLQLISKKMI
jgi:hypothetical protein